MTSHAKGRKAARQKAWNSALVDGGAPTVLSEDPVIHRGVTLGQILTLGPLAACAAVGAHVIFTGTVWLASEALSHKPKKVRDETIVVKIEDPIPPKIEPIETEAETKVEPEPAPEPKPKPKPKPEPENKPKPKPKPADTPDLPPPPRKIVGLNLGSTVAGGNGPSFATGTSLDGETDSKAVDPNQAAHAPKDGATDGDIDAPKTNRKATRIPTAGVTLVKPKPKSRVKPTYPPTLRAQGIEANVVVEVSIDASGNVTKARLIDGSKYDDMNAQALIAAKKETFSPATRDGVAIPFTITYTIRFRLND